MSQLLNELYEHQARADAERWKVFDAHPNALEDEKIRKRIHHIYQAQKAFLLICKRKF